MTEPAAQRLLEAIGVAWMHPDERRRAGSAVQIFVAATDREVGIGPAHVNGQRPGRMRQIPDRQRADAMRGGRERRHVVQRTAAIVDLRQQQHAHRFIERIEQLLRADQPQRAIELPREALRDVEVGREVAALGHDHPLAWSAGALQAQRSAQHLVQICRGRVGCDDFVRTGTDQWCDQITDASRRIDPACAVPAADQAVPPLLVDDRTQPARNAARLGAKRITVEVDRALG